MEQYLKPSLEIVVFEEGEIIFTSLNCGGNPAIKLPEVP